MKKYNQSALSAKGRRVIFEEAKKGGVIIQRKSTSGEVLDEFILCTKDKCMDINNTTSKVLRDFAEWWGVDGYMEGDKITNVIDNYIKEKK